MATDAIPQHAPLDMSGLEIRNVKFHMLASDPGSPANGDFWLNTTSGLVKFRAGGTTYVVATTATSGGVASVTAANSTITIGGTSTDPTVSVANLGITNAQISASAAIALSKLATDPLARANHTGAQAASTISDFDAQVRTSRVDQMATATNPVTVPDGTGSGHAVNKGQLDAAVAGLSFLIVRAASTANVNISNALENGDALDGVTLATGDFVLLKNQTTASENGPYIVPASGAASRHPDYNTSAEVKPGLLVTVNEGTANADTEWRLTTNGPITLGTTSLTFTQVPTTNTIAGAGLSQTGNTVDVNVDGSTIEVSSDTLRVKDLGITNAKLAAGTIDLTAKVTGALPIANGGTNATTAAGARSNLGVRAAPQGFDVGDGSATAYTLTHNLNSYDVTVQVFRNSGDRETVGCIVERPSVNTCLVRFASAPSSNQFRAVVS